jgi:RNA polymerase sigma-70 factor (TIGR02943 family)
MSDAPYKQDTIFPDSPEQWVRAYGDPLYRFAMARVRDPGIAEDMVQETFLAALKGRESFTGRSSVLSWMIGILKHKIVDHLRKSRKELSVETIDPYAESTDDLFDEKGRWKAGPEKWGTNPAEMLEQQEFFKVFYKCLHNLSRRLSLAFTLREVDGLESEEICKVLSITTTNLWVLIYRARAKLRACLEKTGHGLTH